MKIVHDIAPEWVLAEHGGPYVFNEEDYARRMKWGTAAGKACDALCLSGDHLRDWSPPRVSVEPVSQTAKPGAEVSVKVASEPFGKESLHVKAVLQGRGLFPDQTLDFAANSPRTLTAKVQLPANITPGRHVFAVRVSDKNGIEFCDPYFAVDVPGP